MSKAILINIPESILKRERVYQISSPIRYYYEGEQREAFYLKAIVLENAKSKKLFTHAYPATPSGKLLSLEPLNEIAGENYKECLKRLGYYVEEKR